MSGDATPVPEVQPEDPAEVNIRDQSRRLHKNDRNKFCMFLAPDFFGGRPPEFLD